MQGWRGWWSSWGNRPAGHFDGRRNESLCGWLCDPRQPQRRLWVRLQGEDGASVTVLADHYRADVRSTGFRDGYSGFVVPLNRFTVAGSFRCFDAEQGIELAGSPGGMGPARTLLREAGNLRVGVEQPRRGDECIAGFAVDLAQPFQRQHLALVHRGQTLAQTRACLFNGTARSAGGDGFNGFAFQLPQTLRRTACIVSLDRQQVLVDLRLPFR
jgi:hypothetical protein